MERNEFVGVSVAEVAASLAFEAELAEGWPIIHAALARNGRVAR